MGQLHVELVSSVVQSQRNLCKWPDLKMSTLGLVVVLQPLVTSPRQPSRPFAAPVTSSLLTCGRKRSYSHHLSRNTPIIWRKITNKAVSNAEKSRTTKQDQTTNSILHLLENQTFSVSFEIIQNLNGK